ncbi:hypothetical protein LINGRAHAP2_LOCUS30452 [Linum grandiflorum]
MDMKQRPKVAIKYSQKKERAFTATAFTSSSAVLTSSSFCIALPIPFGLLISTTLGLLRDPDPSDLA